MRKILFIALLFSVPAVGSEPDEETKNKFTMSTHIGSTFGGSSTTSIITGGARASTDSNEKGQFSVGAEGEFRPKDSPFSVGAILDFSRVDDEDKLAETTAQAAVKYHIEKDGFDLWAGLGAGYTVVTFDKTEITSGSNTVFLAEKTKPAIGVSGRIGADYRVSGPFFVGAQVGLHNYALRSQMTIRNNTSGASTTVDYRIDRTWASGAVRLGLSF